MSLADYQTAVDDLVRDRDGVITGAQRDAAIDAAVSTYSAAAPRNVVVDVNATLSGNSLDLPAGWGEASQLVCIEYPVGQWQPSLVPLTDVRIYASPTGKQLRLPVTMQAGDAVRITYTAAHLLDAADDTLPQRHRQAVASLAASLLCGQLASYYAGESESTISADTVDRKSKSDIWRARSRDLAAVYTGVVGAAPAERKQGASAVAELTRPNSLGGRPLFHPPTGWPR